MLDHCLRRWPNIDPTLASCLVFADHINIPANMRRWPNIGLLLTHSLRRWPNSKPPLGQRLTFDGMVALIRLWQALGWMPRGFTPRLATQCLQIQGKIIPKTINPFCQRHHSRRVHLKSTIKSI